MMGHRAAVVVRLLLGLAAFVGLASCAVTDPTLYYTLGRGAVSSSAAGMTQAKADAPTPLRSVAGTGAVGVGVGPVIMPGYLDRVMIVTRTSADTVSIANFHRWAEPLEDGIARVLTDEIAARVPTERVVMFPWRGVVARDLQYQVVIVVLLFDGRPGGAVTLDTRWRIISRDGKELLVKRSTVTETATAPGYEAMVAAMTRALVALGGDIAAEIRALPS